MEKLNQDKESHRLWHRLNERFVKAMATYHLIEDDDRILVGLSGGKDSLLLLEMLAKRSRIQHPRFTVEALHVRMANIHYETDTSYLQQFCDNLGVKLHVLTTSFEVTDEEIASNENLKFKAQSSKFKRKQKTPCFLCSWNRRKQMFNRRPAAYGIDESHLPRPIRHHARPTQDAQDATRHHPSAVYDRGERHQAVR